jgi:L-rhamnose mutarotase
MPRICFTMRVSPRSIGRYERLHREAWPELLLALHRHGWRNYSLFLRDDGFLVGYLESSDWVASRASMDAEEVAARWSVEMDALVVPGTRMRWLECVATTGGPAADPGAARAVGVGTRFTIDEVARRRAAIFRDIDGTIVAYVEDPVDAAAAASALVPGSDPGAFRRVFDLEGQLAALGVHS